LREKQTPKNTKVMKNILPHKEKHKNSAGGRRTYVWKYIQKEMS
jgi:hypothetical protein